KSNTVRFLCGNEKSKIENITDDVCGMIDLIRQDIGSRTRSVRTHDEGHGRRTQDEGHGRRHESNRCSTPGYGSKEELLATCYVAVSEDNNVGRSQKHETFWYRVLNEFNSKNFQNRTKDMLTSKWHTLNANCQKFNAAYKRAKRLGKSGENDVDYLKRAQSIYRDEHRGVAFSQEDAWPRL
ncbi:hypothetical protein Tco_0887135, partial [Tanacetum coccineum]